jgi:phosphotransferase family enzyme
MAASLPGRYRGDRPAPGGRYCGGGRVTEPRGHAVTAEGVTPAVAAWVERTVAGARVTGAATSPLAGGSVARWVERMTLHLAGGHGPVELVRKEAAAHEIAGLRAAQAARAEGTAIPDLVAYGDDWLIIPFAPGAPLDWGDPVPANLFDSLAALHARYHGGASLPAAIPRITPAWWQALCLGWVDPRLAEAAGRHPAATTVRARTLVGRAAGHPAAAAVLADLTPTLVHGDVHPGNVLADPVAGRATLIDWGGVRVGPAALDLANLVTEDSADVARYAATWRRLTGQPLPAGPVKVGYRWAALQIHVQYLPWIAGHRPTRDVEAALDRIEQAISGLTQPAR